MTKRTATLDVHGDILEVTWDGNVWVSPCNGMQHARAIDAMRSELTRYLSDCGEHLDEDEVDAMLENIKE